MTRAFVRGFLSSFAGLLLVVGLMLVVAFPITAGGLVGLWIAGEVGLAVGGCIGVAIGICALVGTLEAFMETGW